MTDLSNVLGELHKTLKNEMILIFDLYEAARTKEYHMLKTFEDKF